MGGPASELVGDKIAQRVFIDRNLPHASALSVWRSSSLVSGEIQTPGKRDEAVTNTAVFP
ncbi:MAG: hypothetical protein V8T87_08330 [Victivallales bacterium]